MNYYEEGQEQGRIDPYQILLSDARLEVRLICGPEGGFTDEEVNNLISRGAKNINLGPRVLRAETASTCALSIAQYLWGDLKN